MPKYSIDNLVRKMDSDNDGKVTLDDIKKFSEKNFIYLPDETYKMIFEDCIKNRITIYEEQKKNPLNIQEIWQTCQLHYKKNGEKWEEIQRPSRKYWMQYLEIIGEKNPAAHDLPKIKIQPIADLHELNEETFHPQINKSKSCVAIKPLTTKCYQSPFRAEAGIIINNTKNIEEVNWEKDAHDTDKVSPFEKVVNSRMKQQSQDGTMMITFETQMYFNEAVRLMRNPKLYLKQKKNPIYSFVPENFNFQQQLQQSQQAGGSASQFQLGSGEQLKKIQSMRGSKMLSSNFIYLNENDSSAQMRDLDDIDELEVESLMKTQSIPQFNQKYSTKNILMGSK